MEKIKLAIVVMVLAVVTGCASDPTKHSYAMNVMKSLEFDEGLRDQEIPPGEYAKLKEVRVTRPGDSIETATSTAALTGAAGIAYMAGGLSWGTFGTGGIALTSIIDLMKVEYNHAASSFFAIVGEQSKYKSEKEFQSAIRADMKRLFEQSLADIGAFPQHSSLPEMSYEEKKAFNGPPRRWQAGYHAYKINYPPAGTRGDFYVTSNLTHETRKGDLGHGFNSAVLKAEMSLDPNNLASQTPVYVAFGTPHIRLLRKGDNESDRAIYRQFHRDIMAALTKNAPPNALIYIAPNVYEGQIAPYVIYRNQVHFFVKEVAPK